VEGLGPCRQLCVDELQLGDGRLDSEPSDDGSGESAGRDGPSQVDSTSSLSLVIGRGEPVACLAVKRERRLVDRQD